VVPARGVERMLREGEITDDSTLAAYLLLTMKHAR
jgi:urease accessory protein UreF